MRAFPASLLPNARSRSAWPARRFAHAGLVILIIGAVVAFAITGTRLVRRIMENRAIAALAAGRDVPVPETAGPRLLLARVHFLAIRGYLDEAQPIVDRLSRSGDTEIVVAALYNLANARISRAITHLESNDIDAAAPQVRLAKAAYRTALALQPDFWNGKYNLDIAMRLVRDLPLGDQESEDEAEDTPKRLWTDLPGLPRGLP